jgi:hypothetical protein
MPRVRELRRRGESRLSVSDIEALPCEQPIGSMGSERCIGGLRGKRSVGGVESGLSGG